MGKRYKILHAFQWSFNAIAENAQKIKEQGFDAVQFSPCQGVKDGGYEFWKLYQPLDIGFVPSTQLGNLKEYKTAIKACHAVGLKVVQDVVLRHVASADSDTTIPHSKVAKDLQNPEYYINSPELTDENSRLQLTTYRTGTPMLDYLHPYIQVKIRAFLYSLYCIEVDAIRLDMAKHFLLPSEGGGGFFLKLFNRFDPELSYGETLDTDSKVLDEITESCKILSWSANVKRQEDRVLYFDSHDMHHTWRCSVNMSDGERIHNWERLCRDFPNNNLLYFPKPFEKLWESETIKNINTKY
ncbi:hypothetical protein [Clostridium felsineum]|uniref:hypothetical protein n=1 Tax=Clostridium felsineum TaxID=36839 RepID=UPI00098C9B93|nr:hypothetical protein [Clostridium felsineum]URZ16888.1 hypothetical protein CLFE_029350 [Clostridium felsineum DSM 794]